MNNLQIVYFWRVINNLQSILTFIILLMHREGFVVYFLLNTTDSYHRRHQFFLLTSITTILFLSFSSHTIIFHFISSNKHYLIYHRLLFGELILKLDFIEITPFPKIKISSSEIFLYYSLINTETCPQPL